MRGRTVKGYYLDRGVNAMAIAFFYAIGTAVGGISGPLLFGVLITQGKRAELAVGYLIGAVLMIAAGLVEVWLGVNAEQKPLEEIATPLTAEDADQHPAATGGAGTGPAAGQEQRRRRQRLGRVAARWPGRSCSGAAGDSSRAHAGAKRSLSPSLRSTERNHRVDAAVPATTSAMVAAVESIRNILAGSVTIIAARPAASSRKIPAHSQVAPWKKRCRPG